MLRPPPLPPIWIAGPWADVLSRRLRERRAGGKAPGLANPAHDHSRLGHGSSPARLSGRARVDLCSFGDDLIKVVLGSEKRLVRAPRGEIALKTGRGHDLTDLGARAN